MASELNSSRSGIAIPGGRRMPRVASLSSITPTAEDEVLQLRVLVEQLEKTKTDQGKQIQEYKRKLEQLRQDLTAKMQQIRTSQKQLSMKFSKKGRRRSNKDTSLSQEDIRISSDAASLKHSGSVQRLNVSGSNTPLPTGSKKKPPASSYGTGGRKRNAAGPKGFFNWDGVEGENDGADGRSESDDDEETEDLSGWDSEEDVDDDFRMSSKLLSPQRGSKGNQRTWSAPALFSHSPEFSHSPSRDKIQTLFKQFERDPLETLFNACAHGKTSVVESILAESQARARVDINSRNGKGAPGFTPLALAIKNRHLKVAGLLVEAGANVDESDPQGNTALHLALLNPANGDNGLLLQLIDSMIEKTKMIDHQNDLGNTPLLLAVHNSCSTDPNERICYEAVVRSLLDRGANVNLKNKYHESPLIIAAKEGSLDVVSNFLERPEVEIDATDKSGGTPLYYAALYNHHAICERLVQCGASLQTTTEQGKTPLSVAMDPKIRKLLEDYDPSSRHWKWLVPLEDLEIKDIVLGEGKFAKCMLGKLYGTYVAVKKYKLTKPEAMQQFQYEVGLMSDIRHPNVLLFLGACFSGNHLCILTEYLPVGPLRKYLKRVQASQGKGPTENPTTPQLSRNLLFKFAITTATGMAWLHSRKPVLLHRDLHANNILLTTSLECKVADLGLSQIEVHSTLRAGDQMFYQRTNPPEVWKGDKYSTASDIYQYGMVLYEMLFLGEKATQDIDFETLTLAYNQDVLELMKRCVREQPWERPASFIDIVDTLESMQHDVDPTDRAILEAKRRVAVDEASCADGDYIE